mmetsp:Transcript_45394/g.116172  ORF Transcript_45394/g.116172 Transcript_45394/m.116172 type:complete len:320 (+) Transcript_45394:215-1174(+)
MPPAGMHPGRSAHVFKALAKLCVRYAAATGTCHPVLPLPIRLARVTHAHLGLAHQYLCQCCLAEPGWLPGVLSRAAGARALPCRPISDLGPSGVALYPVEAAHVGCARPGVRAEGLEFGRVGNAQADAARRGPAAQGALRVVPAGAVRAEYHRGQHNGLPEDAEEQAALEAAHRPLEDFFGAGHRDAAGRGGPGGISRRGPHAREDLGAELAHLRVCQVCAVNAERRARMLPLRPCAGMKAPGVAAGLSADVEVELNALAEDAVPEHRLLTGCVLGHHGREVSHQCPPRQHLRVGVHQPQAVRRRIPVLAVQVFGAGGH